jgi:hypothetical protein
MADDHRAFPAAGPVPASGIATGRRIQALRVRAGQDVVHVVGLSATARNLFALLAERGFSSDLVVVAMQILNARGDDHAFGVLPGAFADAVTRVDAGLAARFCRAQIGAPGLAFAPGRFRELLAVRIRAGKPAEVRALAGAFAGDEEGHRALLGPHAGGGRNGKHDRAGDGDFCHHFHLDSPCSHEGRFPALCGPAGTNCPTHPG